MDALTWIVASALAMSAIAWVGLVTMALNEVRRGGQTVTLRDARGIPKWPRGPGAEWTMRPADDAVLAAAR